MQQCAPGSLSQYKLGDAVVISKPSSFCDLTWQMLISCPYKAQVRVAVLHVVTQQCRLFPSSNSSISTHGLREHLRREMEATKTPLPLLTALPTDGTTHLFCL